MGWEGWRVRLVYPSSTYSLSNTANEICSLGVGGGGGEGIISGRGNGMGVVGGLGKKDTYTYTHLLTGSAILPMESARWVWGGGGGYIWKGEGGGSYQINPQIPQHLLTASATLNLYTGGGGGDYIRKGQCQWNLLTGVRGFISEGELYLEGGMGWRGWGVSKDIHTNPIIYLQPQQHCHEEGDYTRKGIWGGRGLA